MYYYNKSPSRTLLTTIIKIILHFQTTLHKRLVRRKKIIKIITKLKLYQKIIIKSRDPQFSERIFDKAQMYPFYFVLSAHKSCISVDIRLTFCTVKKQRSVHASPPLDFPAVPINQCETKS